MAWQTPKTDWAAADGVRNTDINRIEGNILELRNQATLIGVYQMLGVSVTTQSSQTLTVNPIPTSWTPVVAPTEYVNGAYRIKTDNAPSNQQIYLAFDGNVATPGVLFNSTTNWATVELPEAIKVTKVKCKAVFYDSQADGLTIQGSNNGSTWTDLLTVSDKRTLADNLVELTLTSPGTYKYYRFYSTTTGTGRVDLYELQISAYEINKRSAAYTLALSGDLLTGQIVRVQTPTTYSSDGVTQNTLNGKAIDTILQPGTKYALSYTGTGFNVVEVV